MSGDCGSFLFVVEILSDIDFMLQFEIPPISPGVTSYFLDGEMGSVCCSDITLESYLSFKLFLFSGRAIVPLLCELFIFFGDEEPYNPVLLEFAFLIFGVN